MKKNIYYADETDFIHSKEVDRKYGIGVGEQISLLDSGQLSAFERVLGRYRTNYPTMVPDAPEPDRKPIKEYELREISLKKGLTIVDGELKAEYHPLYTWKIGRLTKENVKELYFLRSEVESTAGPTLKKDMSDTALARKKLVNHVMQRVNAGTIKSKDDLRHDPTIIDLKKEQGWSFSTVEDYTRNCGIPEKKRGRKRKK